MSVWRRPRDGRPTRRDGSRPGPEPAVGPSEPAGTSRRPGQLPDGRWESDVDYDTLMGAARPGTMDPGYPEESDEERHQRDRAIADAVAQTYLYGGSVIATLQWARKFQANLAEEGWQVVRR